ncbi:ABC-three component system protein [Geofilum rubicundum]|uniref:ABC-three component systems C-terminal domain-containing protein n=1 Tax=Geofilum rubicundum JCM 15548 TaxID=1236989 RepID=A0A0E9LZZ1_9BACT|nr:ABC-three component system protein [Geofilum rubicundum]GAO31142.1 hypothetical protein JCM15548_13479 [Geofilum rubicundum JCM 15548]
MDYRLENINDADFERLVNAICQRILGTGVIEFSPGKDGGRDGKFIGIAQNYPSTNDCWKGKFIIQAKHTENYLASCSDKEFGKIIDDEIIKIKKLKANGEIDNYLLFTNRKYSGVKGERLLNLITKETGIENCAIIGKETINNQYLNSNKDIVKQFKLDITHIQFDFSDEEIKDIILAFKSQLPGIKTEIKVEVDKLKQDFTIIDKKEKNKKNSLSEEYFNQFIVSESLMDFDKIEKFLYNPLNENLKDYYFDTAYELNQLISLKRDDFDLFEEIFVFIYKLICDGSTPLKGSKRHVMVFLHYMYYECLIGKKVDNDKTR